MEPRVMLITGARKGIGRYLAEYYSTQGYHVVGCSRQDSDFAHANYEHSCLDVADEGRAQDLFSAIRTNHGRLDVLLNVAGIAAMNHILTTPTSSLHKILDTNVVGTFLFCREGARLMQKRRYGRIVNFTTVAVPLKLAGESAYAASKAAVLTLTQVMAKELADFGITANAVGPNPISTDLIAAVPKPKLDALVNMQAVKRLGALEDVSNVVDFFIKPESGMITGQVIYLGGIQ
ncbi:MAG: SDR family NAD(P)-dependent oxidoreductase [Acidobacteria bacterium]|nr:SDR family NAD(P)-dependent oxidoreductase [Acidobacteriota bacterium]